MFIAGKKKSIIKSTISKGLICPKCNSKNTTKVFVIGIYKHLIQIPFLSGGKSGESVCDKCNVVFELNNMPNAIKLAYYELKETAKTPIWFYAGLIGIKALILIKIFGKYY